MEPDLFLTIQMQNGLVVVAPAFQRKCETCGQNNLIESVERQHDVLVRHVCQYCQSPYPVSGSEDFFWLFAVPRQFHLEQSELVRRFYCLSRALHPDRFSTQSSAFKAVSLQRMSLVNQAYTTLLSSSLRREYLLSLEGVQGQRMLPQELSEAWFELQDLDPSSDEAKVQIKNLRENLASQNVALEQQILQLENQYDHEYDQSCEPHRISDSLRKILEKIATAVQFQNYLRSLEKEMTRLH